MFSRLLLCIMQSAGTSCVIWIQFPKFRWSLLPPSSENLKRHIPEHSNNHSHRHDHLKIRNCPSSHVVHIVHFYKQNLTMLRSYKSVWEAITNTCTRCMWETQRERERTIHRSPATCVALCDVITTYHHGTQQVISSSLKIGMNTVASLIRQFILAIITVFCTRSVSTVAVLPNRSVSIVVVFPIRRV